jgi:hypothetical protein
MSVRNTRIPRAGNSVTNVTDGITPLKNKFSTYFCGQHGLTGSGNSLRSLLGDYSPRVLGLHPQDDGTVLHRNVGRVGLQYGVNGTRLLADGRTDKKNGRFHGAFRKTQHTLEDQVVEGGADEVPLLVDVGAASPEVVVTPCAAILG